MTKKVNECADRPRTCFDAHAKCGVNCQRKNCEYWFEHNEGNNCVIISAKQGPHTLQKIGQIYGLTRMRICQMEKNIFAKIKETVKTS